MNLKYYQKESECMPLDQLKKLQGERLAKTSVMFMKMLNITENAARKQVLLRTILKASTTLIKSRSPARTIFVRLIHMDSLQFL